ncbi:TBC1 domain family member 31 isoform X2 [Bombus vosnesenskii]|uniref:TBC1 domain family member 31 isoform X2 n=1 Tax=Bombus vosnesenskii TaxID=207650 RepID=A0A6J3LLJ2_9HYME|nr:TBC1 domain family member 31 isoform X2 [Bombus vosnesenskii]XP_050489346.1 TBC1 domain family member 31 isoform X2 [Bombus huntii]
MYKKKWQNLRKLDNNSYELEPEAIKRIQCPSKVNFSHIAFDWTEEHFIASDTAGYLYYIDLMNNCPSYQKLGNVGRATFVAFNPINKLEILVGLATADIKILRINADVSQFRLLIAHKVPPVYVSFYKNYCLTSSHKEVIIWCLNSCNKARQLRACPKNFIIKKTSFSNLGHIVVLYYNDTFQVWNFNQLENNVKIDAKIFGIRNIKDFVFTQNGRAMIIVSTQNKIIILNTCNWNLMKTLNLPDNFIGVKYLSLVPSLDSGTISIMACILSSSNLYFFDLNQSCVIDILQVTKPIKKIAVSSAGRYIAYIEKEGHLKLIISEKLFSKKCESLQKLIEPCRPLAHGIYDHLQCVRQSIKHELRLERLILILKEYGEYPGKYRVLIWSTILNLPANKCSYNALANKAASINFTSDILKNYPLASRSKHILLMTTVHCLIQWCPLLVQCSFLPNLVFPFLIIFQKDLLLGFELILTILLNYCQKWFEYHPLPPLNVLGIIENILLQADPSLLNVFCERGITSSEYAWPLLKTGMSEVLSGPEWLILWDNLISCKKPSLLLMSIVAYSICSREIIISSLQAQESIKRYFTKQGHIGAHELLKVAQQLDNNLPLRIHPSHYLRDEVITLPSKGPYPPFMLHDFPKFLTDEISVLELEKLKKKQRIMRQCNQKIIEIAEINRLEHEAKAFMDQINQTRLKEAHKSFKQQLFDANWEIRTEQRPTETYKASCECICDQFHGTLHLNLDTTSDKDIVCSKNGKTKRYFQLQEDVNKLEYEVQSFLSSLRSQKSRVVNS